MRLRLQNEISQQFQPPGSHRAPEARLLPSGSLLGPTGLDAGLVQQGQGRAAMGRSSQHFLFPHPIPSSSPAPRNGAEPETGPGSHRAQPGAPTPRIHGSPSPGSVFCPKRSSAAGNTLQREQLFWQRGLFPGISPKEEKVTPKEEKATLEVSYGMEKMVGK